MLFNKINFAPILIVGMHRSGTSLLARSLQKAGLFIGSDLDNNHESRFFQSFNEWILREAGGSWVAPDFAHDALQHSSYFDHINRNAYCYLNSIWSVKYFGLRGLKSLFVGSLTNWGWKDPRNSYTAPIWLKIFPQAKILHVKRHGVDVAVSLKKRVEKAYRSVDNCERFTSMYSMKLHVKNHFAYPVTDLEFGLSLWERYLENASSLASHAKYLDVKYEDFVCNTRRVLSEVLAFLEISANSDQLEEISNIVNPSRVYAYEQDGVLADFARRHRRRLSELGY